MKKYLLGMSAIAMLCATSCQDDMNLPGNVGESTTVAFNVSTPEIGTRSYSDGKTADVLQYAVYDAAGNLLPQLKKMDATIDITSKVELQLTTGNEYTVVFWAEAPDAPYTANFTEKLADANVEVDYTGAKSNDENRDAFYAKHTFTVKGAQTETVKLYRPFAQLNIGTADYTASTNAGYTPEYSYVKVPVSSTLNLNDGSVGAATVETFGVAKINKEETFPVDGYQYLAMNYLLVPADKSVVDVEFGYSETEDGEPKTRKVGSVPVQRNYRTNIYGQLLTSDVDINVTIEPNYFEPGYPVDGKYTYFVVETNDELKAALTSNHEHIYVELTGDATYDVAAWDKDAMGGDKTNSITINGEKVITRGTAPTLTFNQTNSDWNNIATKNGAKLILKNLNVTNAGKNNGPWNRHDLNFACDVEMENVVSDKAIALKAGGVLKNVTIDDANGSDTYALWIQPKGQVVTLEGCTIDMIDCTDGRGIKIDEQYLDEVKAPTLNVSGTTFLTEEKAAVIVKSKDGAIINWGEDNNISEVAADANYAVWIDEASKAYADKVIVNGAKVRVEGSTVVADASAILDALKDGGDVVLDGNITSTALLAVNGGALFDGKGYTITFSGVDPYESALIVKEGTLQNVTVTGAYRALGTGGSGSYPMTGDAYFKNVTTVGATYGFNISNGNGHKIYVDNCVIGDWNSYAGLSGAEFTNCTFIAQGNYKAAQRVYGNVTFTYKNCTFPVNDPYDSKKYHLNGKDGKPTLVFENCRMSDGTVLSKDNFTTYFGGSSITYKVINN